jgi:hypothetical protein
VSTFSPFLSSDVQERVVAASQGLQRVARANSEADALGNSLAAWDAHCAWKYPERVDMAKQYLRALEMTDQLFKHLIHKQGVTS